MGKVDVTINYQQEVNRNKFGHYDLFLYDSENNQYSIPLKFDFDKNYISDTSSVAFDFLIFAMSVYNADRAVNRAKYSDDGWKRTIHLCVPVLNVTEMNHGKAHFKSAIDFLTGDDWDFEFIKTQPYNYFPSDSNQYNLSNYEKVSLFSGGLDSLIGFIDECSNLSIGKKILLVSHIELGKEGGDQYRILKKCKENNLFKNQYDRAFISAGLKTIRGNKLETEATFRARSILFFAAGIYFANAISQDMPLIVPENGTISLNIPLDKGRRSACSTRTTHPVFLKRIHNALISIGIKNKLYNPYQLKSKKDMVDICCQNSEKKKTFELLYKESCSCAKRSHKHYWERRNVLHCGVCLPCIYRRVSLSGLNEQCDEPVGLDIFTPKEIQINRTDIKRNRDIRSLLYFLKNRCKKEIIEIELIANGITAKEEVNEYTEFVLHSYNQVKDWLKTNGDATIRQKAGL